MNFATDLNDRMFHRGLQSKSEVRLAVMYRARSSGDFRQRIIKACEEDPLLFLNLCGCTYDPRRMFPHTEFLLYPYQEKAAVKILDAIGSHDLRIIHSADMGVSWLNTGLALWMWLFRPNTSLLFVTQIEKYLSWDKPWGVFWRLQYMYDSLPTWMQAHCPVAEPAAGRKEFRFVNSNGSVIMGEAESDAIGLGDRCTAVFIEDAGSFKDINATLCCTRDVTRSRIISGRLSGSESDRILAGMRCEERILHWSDNPEKAAGLYRGTYEGFLHIFDHLGYPDDYEPVLDGKLRSPWYDKESRACASPQDIARELDAEY